MSMSRPQHLSVPNTPEGIRRINEEQAYYDQDPERYEREREALEEQRAMEAQAEAEEKARWEAEQEAQIEAEMSAQAEAEYHQ
jgi:hypothetical protein